MSRRTAAVVAWSLVAVSCGARRSREPRWQVAVDGPRRLALRRRRRPRDRDRRLVSARGRRRSSPRGCREPDRLDLPRLVVALGLERRRRTRYVALRATTTGCRRRSPRGRPGTRRTVFVAFFARDRPRRCCCSRTDGCRRGAGASCSGSASAGFAPLRRGRGARAGRRSTTTRARRTRSAIDGAWTGRGRSASGFAALRRRLLVGVGRLARRALPPVAAASSGSSSSGWRARSRRDGRRSSSVAAVESLAGSETSACAIARSASSSIPVAIGVAMLRYRLYEIDRVISRTLVYGALTVILGAAYAGLVLAGQAVFSSFAGGSNLAIAGSTLVVAALFLPLRSRVQRLRRPPLLPPPLRRPAHARGVRRPAARAGRPGRRCRATSQPPSTRRCSPRTRRSGSGRRRDEAHVDLVARVGSLCALRRPHRRGVRARRDRRLRPSSRTSRSWADLGLVVAFGAFAVVGALVAARQPRNAVGWLFLAAPSFALLGAFSDEYASRALLDDESGLPRGSSSRWFAAWTWFPALGAIALVGFVFPNGRLPGPRWRPVLWACVTVILLTAIGAAIYPGPDPPGRGRRTRQAAHDRGDRAASSTWRRSSAAWPSSSCSGRSWRRSSCASAGREVANGSSSSGCSSRSPSSSATSSSPRRSALPDDLGNALFAIAVAAIPIAAGVAILKHRLYDVDVVIRKTLVYGALTVILGAAYVGLVLAGQALFSSFAGGSTSRSPARRSSSPRSSCRSARGFGGVVDRRFYRRRYDAQRTLEAFGARLREQIELDALRARPASASSARRCSRRTCRSGCGAERARERSLEVVRVLAVGRSLLAAGLVARSGSTVVGAVEPGGCSGAGRRPSSFVLAMRASASSAPLIVWSRPRTAIGWLFLAVGRRVGHDVTLARVRRLRRSSPSPTPASRGCVAARSFAERLWLVALGVLVLSCCSCSRRAGRRRARWRSSRWIVPAIVVAASRSACVRARADLPEPLDRYREPARDRRARRSLRTLDVGLLVGFGSSAARRGCVGMVLRFRRSRGRRAAAVQVVRASRVGIPILMVLWIALVVIEPSGVDVLGARLRARCSPGPRRDRRRDPPATGSTTSTW